MKRKEKYYTEEQREVFKFFKILLILVAIIGLLYLFTVYVVNKEGKYERTNNPGTIKYDSIYLGTLLNRADKEYYVMVLDKDNLNDNFYSGIVAEYKTKANHLAVYEADLSNELNKLFLDTESHYTADSVEDLKVKGTTLIKVKNNKIVKFLESKESIVKELE